MLTSLQSCFHNISNDVSSIDFQLFIEQLFPDAIDSVNRIFESEQGWSAKVTFLDQPSRAQSLKLSKITLLDRPIYGVLAETPAAAPPPPANTDLAEHRKLVKRTVILANLPSTVSTDHICAFMEPVGFVTAAVIERAKGGSSATVEFAEASQAALARKVLNTKLIIGGREIVVAPATLPVEPSVRRRPLPAPTTVGNYPQV